MGERTMSKHEFQVGDRVVLEGIVNIVDGRDGTMRMQFDSDRGVAYAWVVSGSYITRAELVACSPEQLEAVTKERDEARAKNNSLRMRITKAADTLVTKRAECAEWRLVADALRKERDEAREQLARVCAQVETLGKDAAMLRGLHSRDRRILDCMETLLGMRDR